MFIPLFVELYKRSKVDVEKRRYQNLAFGRGGVIINRDGIKYIVVGNKEQALPTNPDQYDCTYTDTKFNDMANRISDYRQQSSRRADKTCALNESLLANMSVEKAKQNYSASILAMLLKIPVNKYGDVDIGYVMSASKS